MTFVGKFFGWLSEAWNEIPVRIRVWITALAVTVGLAVGNAVYDKMVIGETDWKVILRVAGSAGLAALIRSPFQVRSVTTVRANDAIVIAKIEETKTGGAGGAGGGG